MKSRITELLEEIKEREIELENAIKTYESEFSYKIKGSKVRFDRMVEQAHRKLKIGVFSWLKSSSLRNVASAPFIYIMIFPFMMIDIFVSLYQLICFSLYKIPNVKRSDYIVIDRHHLHYLNMVEKINCMYCGYVNGLIAYCREVVARTEQYWCPIKHAKKVISPHRHYHEFIDFGDSEKYHSHLKSMRKALNEKL